jgi:hypothetical protein
MQELAGSRREKEEEVRKLMMAPMTIQENERNRYTYLPIPFSPVQRHRKFYRRNESVIREENQCEKKRKQRDHPIRNVETKHTLTSAVLGTTSARNSISMRPLGEPPMEMSKKTTGFSVLMMVY